MKSIGLTGGIGSGKSTVANIFSEFGAVVCDADEINKTLLEPGGAAVEVVLTTFGCSLRSMDGGIDKKALSAIVFNDPDMRKKLESILHPMIMQEAAKEMESARENGAPVFVLEAALLVETGLYQAFDYVVVVLTSRKIALQRVRERDGIAIGDIMARMAAQTTDEQRIRVADYVIDNNGSLDATREQVFGVWQKICG